MTCFKTTKLESILVIFYEYLVKDYKIRRFSYFLKLNVKANQINKLKQREYLRSDSKFAVEEL